ncbi:SusC/RagA family TonB-linked outer membrane protein [Bacteroides thetaiotaomicron]|uniref:SusC/RagA family TonB-linked outer membrane protein n=1 Tax=Bacteroides thetaiotaomicron TaxID=818 RepID=UPI0039B66040
MKVDSFRFSRKATTALLLCTGLVVSQPLSLWAEEGNNVVQTIQQQKVTVKGTVNDALGPVIGASVVEKGNTGNGTITDVDGNFSLSVKPGAILVVSYVGYKVQEVTATVGKMINVTLKEDTEMLDEVVVVGFGTQKKVNLTGSVGVATSKELESRPVTNAVQALQGVVPGLKITTNSGELDKNMNINVRGTGTIGDGSTASPLILIDGMEGDLHTINPQDIESISVLKDAAASSIYGSRAPFGVILVTTKSGKAGKMTVNYNNSFRFASPMNLPESMDSYTFANFMNSALINNGSSPRFTDEIMQKMLDFQAGKISGHGLDPQQGSNTWRDYWTYGYANTDLYKETYRSSVFSQEHNVSLTGGSEKMSFYASMNYLGQGGMLKIGDDGINRYNANLKVSANVTDWAKFNYSVRYTNHEVWRPRAFSGNYYNYYGRQNWPNIPMYDPWGHVMMPNADGVAYGGERRVNTQRLYHQASVVLEPIKNWITNIEFNYRTQDQNTSEETLAYYGYLPDGSLNDSSKGTTALSRANYKENYMNWNIYSSYSHSFNEAHNFKAMLGFQSEELISKYNSAKKYGLMFSDMPEFDLTTGLSGNGEKKDTEVSGSSSEWTTVGFFGRLNYDYKGRYMAEVNLRYDGSSRFRRGSRWVWAPSFSVGWNIAQENFFKDAAEVVNTLKLRASYGELGNQNTNSWYPTYRTMNLGSLNGSWLTANGTKPNTASIGGLISTTLTWETVRTYNVGLDWGLFDNRLTGSFDYFVRQTLDMVGPAPQLPNTLGISAPKTNNCDLSTKGWELSINWKDRLKNGLSYGIGLSLSDQNTYIDRYPGNATGSIDSYMSGKKIDLIWGFETIDIARTQEQMDNHLASLPNGGQNELAPASSWKAGDIMYKDLDGDGKISQGARTWEDHGDLKILGDANPHYFFGLDLNAEYKGFDFRAFFQGVLKHNFWPGIGDASTNETQTGGYFWEAPGSKNEWHMRGFVQHEDYFRAEAIGLEGHKIEANTDAYFPRPISTNGGKNQRRQSRYMQNAAYARLKNLQLGYTLPKSLTNKIGINKCRLFVSGENLFTITSLFDVFDPETCEGGVGGNAYPLSRTWSFGLSLTL